MIKLTFDTGMLSERSIMVSNYHERPLNNSFSGSFSAIIGRQEDVPVIPDFGADPDFQTVEAVNGDGVFALAEARRTLKKAYDAARQPEPEHEYKPES